MIEETAKIFESLANDLGLSIRIPRPSKSTKRFSAISNGVVGSGLLASGIIYKKPSLTVLGTISLTSSIILILEK